MKRIYSRLFRHAEFTRFIVLSRSRTGSNLLVSYLNSHPNIVVEREIFRRLRGRDPEELLNRAFGEQRFRVKAKGFKVFYYHPLDQDGTATWTLLAAMPELKVIHLKRRNVLRTLLSRKIAEVTDRWEEGTRRGVRPRVATMTVSFSAEELEEGFRATRLWEVQGDRRFASHAKFCLYYEDLVANPDWCFRRLGEFLGVDYRTLHTTLRKQNIRPLSEAVSNYAELKEKFASSRWAAFFDE